MLPATFKTAHRGYVNAVTFSPDDKILASGSRGGTVELWDVQNQQRITALSGHKDEIRVLVFSPDGKTVATAAKGETIIVLWDVINIGRKTGLLTKNATETGAVTFSPEWKNACQWTQGRDRFIHGMSQPASNFRLSQAMLGNVTALAFSPDGQDTRKRQC